MRGVSAEGACALEVVVCLGLSVVEVVHLARAGELYAGPAERVALPESALGGQPRRLLATLDAAGRATCATSLGGEGTRVLAVGEGATLSHDDLRVFVRLVPHTRVAVAAPAFAPDRPLVTTLAVAAVSVLGFLALAGVAPDDRETLSVESLLAERRAIAVSIKPNEDELRERERAELAQAGGGGAPGQAAGSEASGKMGKPTTRTRGRTQLVGTDARDRPGPADARAIAQQAGPLGVLSAQRFDAIAGQDPQWGSGTAYAFGGDVDALPGDGQGVFGRGFAGNGPGSCPPGATNCKDGLYGTGDGYDGVIAGNRPGDGEGGPGGPDGPKLRDRERPSAPTVHLGQASCGEREDDPCLDPAILRRVIRTALPRIAHCYERELQVGRASGGTLTMSFMINQQGRVSAVKMRSSDDGVAATEACVADALRPLQFPALAAPVTVSYPFNFRAT